MTMKQDATQTSVIDPRRARLTEIREGVNWTVNGTLSLDDVKFLIELAINDYDLTGSDVAANVEVMLTSETAWEDFAPVPRPPPVPRTRPAPIGPLTRVDVYECEDDRTRVEVERAPGTDDLRAGKLGSHVREELAAVVPVCPACESEMTMVERKLRKAGPRSFNEAARRAGGRVAPRLAVDVRDKPRCPRCDLHFFGDHLCAADHEEHCAIRTTRDGWDADCDCRRARP